MGKIILGTSEVKKIYLGEQEVSKVYLGDVEVWSASHVRVPPWFPEGVDPVQVLYSYWPTDMSQYFVDVCFRTTVSSLYCMYARCYCNKDNSLQLYSSYAPQLFVSYTVDNSRVSSRWVVFAQNGATQDRGGGDWSQYNVNASGGVNIVSSEMYIIEQGHAYTKNLPYTPHIIPQ